MPTPKRPDPHANGIDYILGTTFVQYLDAPLVTLGKLVITRRSMATDLGLATPGAIRRFATLCADLKISSTADLHRRSPMDLADYPGCGVTTLYVAIRVLQHTGYDIAAWYARATPDHAPVTFSSLKHRVASAERRAASRTARRARTR